ncbi:MAG TPA: ABC transporter permease [Steroidobacteraceae bacterium]|jgi:putative ABC transport system permease protein|nr:ABC transporter permease [Steroidobacteraceae bacterium]
MAQSRMRTTGWLIGSLIGAAGAIALLVLAPWWLLLAAVLLLALWTLGTRIGRQAWSVTQVGLATIPQRLGASLVVVVGIAGVVAVLVALLAMAAGFEAALKESGTDDTAIVMRAGAQTEINSVLDHDSATLVAQAPQVLRNAQGQPIASPELVVVAALPKKSSGLDANVEVRGVGERAWSLRPGVRIIDGRKFGPGLRELIVGQGARGQFAGVDIGSTLKLNGQTWTVVGVFDSGDAHNSELWADTDVVAATYRRGSSTAAVTVRLTGADAFEAFKAGLASDPRLTVDAKTTRAYYTDQSAALAKLIRVLGVTIATIMAIGAVFGALNTMYAAVATRSREIATLRAIGFRGLPVIASVLFETMLLALLGGVLGAILTWIVFNHYTVSTLGQNFTQVVFAFQVSPPVLWTGLKWALAIGLIGGLFPALRAARQPVTAGLREL